MVRMSRRALHRVSGHLHMQQHCNDNIEPPRSSKGCSAMGLNSDSLVRRSFFTSPDWTIDLKCIRPVHLTPSV